MQSIAPMNRITLHEAFEVGIFLKGINGVFELIAALVVSLLDLAAVDRFLLEPHMIFGHLISILPHEISSGTRLFMVLYLLTHGIFKVFLAASLHKQKAWAYPTAVVLLSLFVSYQSYRLVLSFSPILFGFTCLDFTLIVLITREQRRQSEANLS